MVSYIAFSPQGSRSQPGLFPLLQGQPDDSGYAAYAIPVEAEGEAIEALEAGVQNDIPVIGFQVGVPGLAPDYEPGVGSTDLGERPGVVVGTVAPSGPAPRRTTRRPAAPAQQPGRFVSCGRNPGRRGCRARRRSRLRRFEDLLLLLRRKQVGDRVELEVQRGRELLRLELELGGKRTVFGG